LSICQWFGLKTTVTVFSDLASKPVTSFCQWFGFKTTWTIFFDLASKPVMMISPGLTSKLVVASDFSV
jgi:hypothetical protein